MVAIHVMPLMPCYDLGTGGSKFLNPTMWDGGCLCSNVSLLRCSTRTFAAHSAIKMTNTILILWSFSTYTP